MARCKNRCFAPEELGKRHPSHVRDHLPAALHDVQLLKISVPCDPCCTFRVNGGVFLPKLLGYNFSVVVSSSFSLPLGEPVGY